MAKWHFSYRLHHTSVFELIKFDGSKPIAFDLCFWNVLFVYFIHFNRLLNVIYGKFSPKTCWVHRQNLLFINSYTYVSEGASSNDDRDREMTIHITMNCHSNTFLNIHFKFEMRTWSIDKLICWYICGTCYHVTKQFNYENREYNVTACSVHLNVKKKKLHSFVTQMLIDIVNTILFLLVTKGHKIKINVE